MVKQCPLKDRKKMKDEEQWSMYIPEGEEENNNVEEWVDADGNPFDLFEIDKD